MTLKYESEILFDLMKRDGDDTPSDVLPYESELKEKYLQQVEGAYPKLMDYRPEWLNYNLNAHLPADFPVETLSNVTSATVDNVVPYAYGSASLKGQTLVNLMNTGETYTLKRTNPGKWSQVYLDYNQQMLTEGTYILTWDELTTTNETIDIGGLLGVYASRVDGGFQNSWTNNKNLKYIKFQVDYSINIIGTFSIRLHVTKGNSYDGVASSTIKGLKLLKYQEGMENMDIPYFEGMQSVKMPGLTTTGKNLFDIKEDTIAWDGANIKSNSDNTITFTPNSHNNASLSGNLYFKQHIKVKTGTKYTYSMKRISGGNSDFSGTINNQILIRKKDGTIANVIGMPDFSASTFNQTLTVTYVFDDTIESIIGVSSIMYAVGNLTSPIIMQFQLEENSVATPYEPYKSNILTANEEVELRGVDDVKDELNLLTGELTQRIGELVLDGSDDEKWLTNHQNDGENTAVFYIASLFNYSSKVIMDKFAPCLSNVSNFWAPNQNDSENHLTNNNDLAIRISKSRLSSIDVSGFRQWLSQNPVTVQYQLATESIKTVDLTVTDQDGNTESIIRPFEGTMHLMTEGESIKPLFSGEIPVEAITQNLMSFVNMESEE